MPRATKAWKKIVNEDSKSHGDSVDINSKISDEAASVTDKTNVNTEVTTDEETKGISADDSSDAKADVENLERNIENKTGLPKVNSEDKDCVSVGDTKASEENKAKKIKFAKVAAVVTGGVGTIGGATAVVSGLAKSFITGGSSSETGDTKPTYSPDTKSDDTSTELDTDSKSSNTEPTYSPDSEYDDTNTETDSDSKPNKLNQNEKSNNLKKAGIGSGVVIILLLVYVAICRILESMLKNEVIKTIECSFMHGLKKVEVKECIKKH